MAKAADVVVRDLRLERTALVVDRLVGGDLGLLEQAGVALEGIVDLKEAVIDRLVAVEQHLDHTETCVDALKHAMVQFGFGRRHHQG